MEQKLDGLVTLLAASQPQAQPSSPSDSHPFMAPSSLSPDTRTCEFGPIKRPFVPTVPLEEKTQKCSCSEHTTHQGLSGDNVLRVMCAGPRYQDFPGGNN